MADGTGLSRLGRNTVCFLSIVGTLVFSPLTLLGVLLSNISLTAD